MKRKLIKLLTKLRIICGGPIEVVDEGSNNFFYRMICLKHDYEMWLCYDDEVDPGLWAILCGEPWKFTYPPTCEAGGSKWRWDGETRFYELE